MNPARLAILIQELETLWEEHERLAAFWVTNSTPEAWEEALRARERFWRLRETVDGLPFRACRLGAGAN